MEEDWLVGSGLVGWKRIARYVERNMLMLGEGLEGNRYKGIWVGDDFFEVDIYITE